MYGGGPYEVAHEAAPSRLPPAGTSGAARGAEVLQDLTESNLVNEASELLGVTHLSDAQGPVPFPVTGMLYGPCRRPLVCLPTALKGGTYKNIIYMVHSGAPVTELSSRAFEVLGSEVTPAAAYAMVNGQRLPVLLCTPTGDHPGIPVLGADSMSKMGLELRIDYVEDTVTLLKH